MLLQKNINKFYYSMTINELQLMNEKFKSLNITYNSLLYLDIISYSPNCTISYLAKALHISKSAVTIKVNELVKQGLIKKQQSTEDKRVHYLTPVEEIADIYRKYNKAMNHAIITVNETYSEEEQEIFCKIMKDISNIYIKEIAHEQ